jgi:nucleoside-diphosphate-sugar epimerase
VARALIVGCGCRGRELGRRLAEGGWAVRGTTRDPRRSAAIDAAGIESAIADPDRIVTVLEHVADVAIVCWLLGSAQGDPAAVEAVNGPRLSRLLEELVDTPVRGVVYEAAGSVESGWLEVGERALAEAHERWRSPYALIRADPVDAGAWADDAEAAVLGLVG